MYTRLPATSNNSKANTVHAYPNPSKDRFLLNLPENTRRVQVYNITGELVQNLVPEKAVAEINLSGQPAGTYIIKMYSVKVPVAVKVVKE